MLYILFKNRIGGSYSLNCKLTDELTCVRILHSWQNSNIYLILDNCPAACLPVTDQLWHELGLSRHSHSTTQVRRHFRSKLVSPPFFYIHHFIFLFLYILFLWIFSWFLKIDECLILHFKVVLLLWQKACYKDMEKS